MMDLKKDGYAEVATKTVENLVIKKGRCDLATVALADGALELKRGQLLFEGEGGVLAATGAAGKARAILAEDVSAEAAGNVAADVFFGGVFYSTGIIGTLSAADIDALRARDIYIQIPAK
jgi:hypothetical protein